MSATSLFRSGSSPHLSASSSIAEGLGKKPSPMASRKDMLSALGKDSFRREDGSESPGMDRAALMGNVLVENPEAETRWYFKYFLGQEHQNFMTNLTLDDSKTLIVLSILRMGQRVRAILWHPTGSSRLIMPMKASKALDLKSVFKGFNRGVPDKRIEELRDPALQRQLLVLEEQEGAVNFKIGILLAKAGQTTDDEMFSNEQSTPEFDEFCNLMGKKIELQGFDGFRGGLDVRNGSTGSHALHTIEYGKEILFHVSTMLPYSHDNSQQLERKRHLGNDICNIIYQEDEDTEFYPDRIKSQFNHIFAVVSKQKSTGYYTLKVFSKNTVPQYGPPLPCPSVFPDASELRHLLIVKLLNGEKAALASPESSFAKKKQRTLAALINQVFETFVVNKKSPRLGRSENDFTQAGQALKVTKIAAGAAPTSSLGGSDVGQEQWNPLCITSAFEDEALCGDQWGKDLIVGTSSGVYRIEVRAHAPGHLPKTLMINKSVSVYQLLADELSGLMFIRTSSGDESKGSVYAVPFERFSGGVLKKKDLKPYQITQSKGASLFVIRKGQVSSTAAMLKQTCKAAVAIGKKVRTYQYVPVNPANVPGMGSGGDFRLLQEYSVAEQIEVMALGSSGSGPGVLCIGLRGGEFISLDLESGVQETILGSDGKSVPVFTVEVPGALAFQNEFLVCANQTAVVKCADGTTNSEFQCSFTIQPKSLAYMPPYLIGVGPESFEVVTLINGSLVKSFSIPGAKALSTKQDLFFTSDSGDGQRGLYVLESSGFSSGKPSKASLQLPKYKHGGRMGRQLSSTEFFQSSTLSRNSGVFHVAAGTNSVIVE